MRKPISHPTDGCSVTLARGATDRTLPLILGDVRPAGIDLTFLRMYPDEVFRRMARHVEFDAVEMLLSSCLLRRSRGDDSVLAIPVCTSREFRHSCVWVRADADIHQLADLKRKQHGRARVSDDGRGLDPRVPQRRFRCAAHRYALVQRRLGRPRPPGETADQRLRARPAGDQTHRHAQRYADRLFSRTVCSRSSTPSSVIRRELLDREQWVAKSLYDAFCAAKRRGHGPPDRGGGAVVTLSWQIAEVESTVALMGEDSWPCGVEPNCRALETLMRYSCEQGLAQRGVPIEELFASSTLGDYHIQPALLP